MQAEHDEDAGELAEEAGDIGLDREGFEVDDAEKELAVEDAELERQAADEIVAEAYAWIRSAICRAIESVSCSTASCEKMPSRVGSSMRERRRSMESSATTLAAMEDDDAGADALDGVELVGAEKHDFAARGELLDEAAQHQGGGRRRDRRKVRQAG